MPSCYVSIDMGEFNTSELIEELSNRTLWSSEKKEIMELLRTEDGGKFDLFLRIIDKFTITELEDMFKENVSCLIPKEQLSLPF